MSRLLPSAGNMMTPGKWTPGAAGALQPGIEMDDNKALIYNPSSAQ